MTTETTKNFTRQAKASPSPRLMQDCKAGSQGKWAAGSRPCPAASTLIIYSNSAYVVVPSWMNQEWGRVGSRLNALRSSIATCQMWQPLVNGVCNRETQRNMLQPLFRSLSPWAMSVSLQLTRPRHASSECACQNKQRKSCW